MVVHLRIEGPDSQVLVAERAFSEPLITIGRDADNVLQLDDYVISRHHASIRNDPAPALVDHGSRNATFVNGRRLEPESASPLQTGDRIRIGPFHLVFHHQALPEQSPPTAGMGDGEAELPAFSTLEMTPYQAPTRGASREALERAVEELALLNELAVDLGTSLDPDAVMDTVVRRSLEAIGAEQGLITILDDTETVDGEMHHHTMIRTGQEFDLDERLKRWMVEQRRPFLLNNPREHFVFRDVRWKSTLRNLLSAPLLVRGAMTGLLTLYNKRDGPGFSESDLRLATIIASQSAHLIENARLFEQKKELLLMQKEMGVALDIQTNLLPQHPPVIPGYDVAGLNLPAQTVGGDHFDYIPMPDGRWALCLGDVSGKGLPAALVMANLQATLRALALSAESPTACLEGANRLLYESTNRSTFVTLFYSILDPVTHRFRYANAGHNRPLIIGETGVRALDQGGFVLGALRDVDYEEETFELAPGETLLMFSDGVVEARDAGGTMFDDAALEALVARHRGAPAQVVVDAVLDAVQAFAGEEPQGDDITLLAVRRLP